MRAGAREDISEKFFGALLRALGLDPDASNLPVWWQGWPPREHIRRWRDDLGLSEGAIVAVAKATRRDHPAPPDGPKALDRAMERAARQAKQPDRGKIGATSPNQASTSKSRKRKSRDKPRLSDDELAQFYADMVNSERFLPASMISNTIRDAMLAGRKRSELTISA